MTRLTRVLAVCMVMAMTLGVAGPALAADTGRVLRGVSGKTDDGRTFKGRIENVEFFEGKGGALRMRGTLVGRVISDDGTRERVRGQDFNKRVNLVGAAQESCPILNLDIGAIHLDLLGLVVDLSPIELDITAVPGAGNLLGNLLCAVAGLLDGVNLNAILAALLNAILDELLGR